MSGQCVIVVDGLPESGLDAGATFATDHLGKIRDTLEREKPSSLAIVLAAAGPGHDDWRIALARDLARAYAPVRVNVVAGPSGNARDTLLAYLADAPGVTGQYCQVHD